MKHIPKTFWLLAILTLVCLAPLSAQDTNILSLRETLDLTYYWDAYTNQLTLAHQGRSLTIHPGGSMGILNHQLPISLPGITQSNRGEIMINQEASQRVLDLLNPGIQSPGRRISTIFIDPGHGGKDPGAIGRHTINDEVQELREKDIVLEVAKQVVALLQNQYPEKQVVLSRSDDTYLTLEERTDMANTIHRGPNEDILYISIHANASLNSAAQGYEVWYLPPEYRRELISEDSNSQYDKSVIPILNTLLEEEYTVESILLAQSILTGLDGTLGTLSNNRGLMQEEWYVVRNARMPSVLIEIGFVTNRDEFALLMKPDYLQKISKGIYTGVTSFIANFEEVY